MMKVKVLIGLGVLCLASLAQAEVVIVTNPGLNCVEVADASPEIYYSGGVAYNSDSSSATFQCTMERRYLDLNGADPEYLEDNYWWAYVNDASTTGNVSCFMRSCSSDGTSCISSATRSSTGTGVQGISLFPTVFPSGDYGRFSYLQCSIPAASGTSRSGVVSYTDYEFNDTSN